MVRGSSARESRCQGVARTRCRAGERVAVLSRNSARYFELYFSIPRAGGVIVPLNHRLAEPELAYCMDDSGSVLLLADRDHMALARRISGTVICIDEWETSTASAQPEIEASEDDLFGIFYTGGTTGQPKGVMLSHRNICEGRSMSSSPWDTARTTYIYMLGRCFTLPMGVGVLPRPGSAHPMCSFRASVPKFFSTPSNPME